MTSKSVQMTPELHEYIFGNWVREPRVLRELREETAHRPNAGLQISPEQAPIMSLLLKLLAPKRAIELGTFTGYSSVVAALAMPDDGRLICCEVNEETAAVAERYWKAAGVDHKIQLILGPAMETLDMLLARGDRGSFDFAFIDADKGNYRGYYDRCVELIRSGGLILIDNVLWSGRLADPSNTDPETRQIRELNRFIFNDSRVDVALIPVADGITVIRKL